ncbi:murein L,D-transpeptidase catalytic domain-containing protein [Longimicrobium sp.]|uniref:murein L,D-transpeptidase catalytic domain-containing protein n=1 Tax=Longimicrobium sp. TaxID=2029185 RepID=UPI002E366D0A|nr:murein L,D-transpeptidase catalytic domain family protein [Longimicrobium sp.]HEX6037964.1 murein L,D-transpeptidase catalytic domain family protein [Longimicrobium sp.]
MRRNLLIAAAAFSVGAGGALVHESKPATAPATPLAARMTTAPAPATPSPSAQAVMSTARAVLNGVGVQSAVEKTQVDVALDALGGKVRRQSDPEALRMAFAAYFNYKTANPRDVRKPYLYYVDYGLDSRTPRGYVFDMASLKVVDGPFMVAHGRGSAPPSSGVPVRFSNRQGSNSTSLGLYLAQETYGFSGKTGGRRYTSVGLRMKGLSGRFNSAARARGVVAHGAPYVTSTRAGRSEGCPAMEQDRARTLLPKIANGGLVFLFSPLDEGWMEHDPWANRSNG